MTNNERFPWVDEFTPPDGTRGPQGVWRNGKFWFNCSTVPIVDFEADESLGVYLRAVEAELGLEGVYRAGADHASIDLEATP